MASANAYVIRAIDLEGAEKYVVIRCWDNSHYLGAICLFLPNIGNIRILGGSANGCTMILNLELTTQQREALNRDQFLRASQTGKIVGLNPEVKEIIYNTIHYPSGQTSYSTKRDAKYTTTPLNQLEKEALNGFETTCENDNINPVNNYNISSNNIYHSTNNITTPKIATINYDFDRSETSTFGQDQIDRYKEFLTKNPDYVINVAGYTDKKGDDTYNNTLGLKRATDMKNKLISQGIDANRITVSTYGETGATVDENASDEARKADRKIVIQWEPKR